MIRIKRLILGESLIVSYLLLESFIKDSEADRLNGINKQIAVKKLDKNNNLSDIIAQHNVGDQLNLKIWHKGDTKNVAVTLEERKQ